MLLERINEVELIETNAPDGLYKVLSETSQAEESNFSLPSLYLNKKVEGEYFANCKDCPEIFLSGDIVFLNSRRKKIAGYLCQNAKSNSVLVTEKCDNLCSFCSQPPNNNSDTNLFINAALSIINFNSADVIGITGGEPTLNKTKFIRFLEMLNLANNNTPLHILSNGRAFSDNDFCAEVISKTKGREVVWGIPIHGHNKILHDECVSSEGAFIETIKGIHNLSCSGSYIELRTVVTRKNFRFLKNISELIKSSFEFIPVHAIMNLEPRGWAKKNFESLYVPSREQMPYIEECIDYSNIIKQEVNLFNYPYCLVPERFKKNYHKSISDWKNYYPRFCNGCEEKILCGGFFSSSTGKYMDNVIERVVL